MQMNHTQLNEMQLIGITVRTNNQAEGKPETAKITPCVIKYFQEQLANKIPNKAKEGVTLCAYTEYESDHTGEYTYFIGEQVSTLSDIPEGFKALTIPAQKYAKMTTNAGSMPNILINAWQNIWKMTSSDFGADRRYHTDFEIYDERAQDPTNAVVDIMIGLKD